MSPLLKNVLALSIAFGIGELLVSVVRYSGRPFVQILNIAAPRLAFAVTAGAVIGLGVTIAGIQVAP